MINEDCGSDLAAPDVSKLSLDTASSLQRQRAADDQQQKQQQRAKEPDAAPTPPPETLAAPLPSRPAVSPPPAAMWSPDVGIRFGANAPAAGAAPTAQGGAGMEAPTGKAKAQWSPGKGIRFN